jgi:hypothetical protein
VAIALLAAATLPGPGIDAVDQITRFAAGPEGGGSGKHIGCAGRPIFGRFFIIAPQNIPDGANTLYQFRSIPAAVLTGSPFHSEGSGVATSTFTRLAAASVLATGR